MTNSNFDIASQFVANHVIQNVNELMEALINQDMAIDNIEDVIRTHDWNYAVDEFNSLNPDYEIKLHNGRYDIWNIEDDEIVYQDYETALEAVRDFYHDDQGNFDDITCDVLEYWLVSDWLFDRLSDENEAVAEIYGLKIWGRTCSGQAIALDCNIQAIALDVAANKPWLL